MINVTQNFTHSERNHAVFSSKKINAMMDEYKKRGIQFTYKTDIIRDLVKEPSGGYNEHITDNPPAREEILHLHINKGMRVTDIAEHFRVRLGTAQKWWMMYEIPATKSGRRGISISENELRRMYVDEKMKISEIAEYYSISDGTIRNKLDDYDIKKINRQVEMFMDESKPLPPSKEELCTLYIDKRKNINWIARKYRVDHTQVNNWLILYGIESRRSTIKRMVPDKETLEKQYIDKNLTTQEIAAIHKCSPPTVIKWLRAKGIHIKSYTDINGAKKGSWIDGRSFLPYCCKFNDKLKEKIRERDNRVCQLCGKTESENRIKLSVHHLNYDKENCYPELISLCSSCHTKTNHNREHWKVVLREILEKKHMVLYSTPIPT